MKKDITKLKQIMSRSLLLILVLFTTTLSAQNLTEEQKNALLPKVKQLLKDYELYSQFSTDGVNLNNDYLVLFSAMFDPQMKHAIFNDLTPTKKGTFPSVDLYVDFVKTNYSQGLDVFMDIDGIQIEDAFLKKGSYMFSVKVHKRVTGVFNNQGIHRFNDDLYFTFSATSDEQGNPSNLKINGVLTIERYAQYLINKKWSGISLGVTGLYSQSQIYGPAIYTSDVWKPASGSTIYPGFDLAIMFTNGFGIGTGVRLSSYSSSFAISSYNKTSVVTLTDKDNDKYKPVLNISALNEQIHIKSLDIPILLKFRGGKGKTKFYFDMGVIYSKISNGYFTLEGSSVKSGYYSGFNVTLSDIPEYDFGSFNYTTDKEYELKMGASSISGYTSLGLLFQLAPGLLFKVGGGLSYGLTDLKFDQENPNNYLNFTLSEPVQNTTLRSYGVEIGLLYRISFKR